MVTAKGAAEARNEELAKSEDSDQRNANILAVLQEMLKINGLQPCNSIESGQMQLFKLIQEKYKSKADYEKDIERAMLNVQKQSVVSLPQQGFHPNQNGVLKFKRASKTEYAVSDDTIQKQRKALMKQWV